MLGSELTNLKRIEIRFYLHLIVSEFLNFAKFVKLTSMLADNLIRCRVLLDELDKNSIDHYRTFQNFFNKLTTFSKPDFSLRMYKHYCLWNSKQCIYWKLNTVVIRFMFAYAVKCLYTIVMSVNITPFIFFCIHSEL